MKTARTPVAFLVALLVLLLQISGQAAPVTSQLHYSLGFLVTGGYAVGSVDLHEDTNPPNLEGMATGTINMSGVPADADIVAAYLYWETIALTSTPTQARLKFRDTEIPLSDVVAVQKSSQSLADSTATCWSSGTPLTMTEYRADVLRLLPMRLDSNDKPTGRRLVNNSDLTAHGKTLHTVSLPTVNGNQIPESAGASLVVVYRDSSQPLRKIVLYDGIHIQQGIDEETRLTIRGFYKSAATPSASLSLLIASGQPNNKDVISFEDGETHTVTPISGADPLAGATSAERAWTALTYNVSTLMHPTTTLTGYGENVTVSIKHQPANGGYDCITPAAAIFSTAVADVDHDGLPDGIEDSTSGLTDADGDPLPNLNAMGASSVVGLTPHADLFIEINAMRTLDSKPHGSLTYPYSTGTPIVNVPAHTHMPTPEVLKLVGDAYVAHGITPHFDVGDITAYHGLGVIAHTEWVDDYTSMEADSYLVSANPRGGEPIDEIACDATQVTCQFPGFPGTVGWKFGLQTYRDWPVGDEGQELLTPAEIDAWLAGTGAHTEHRQRFDPNRRGLFHYMLWAHYRGLPKSELPCLDTTVLPGTPTITGWNAALRTCSGTNIAINPEFHIPSSSSGVADLPGANLMVTLGRWDEFVGKPFVRASTMFHELGHNGNLSHGGFAPIPGNKVLSTANYVEPNCKPNYLSSMSYAFQVFGLFMDDDSIHLDYSTSDGDDVGEITSQSDAPLNPAPSPAYRPVWYAPASSLLATTLGVPTATRYCNGLKFDTLPPPVSMARVYTSLSADPINWNGDASTSNTANNNQDVNFDASVIATMRGFDDWTSLRLDQIGAGLKIATLQTFGGGINNFEGGLGNFEGGIPNFEGGITNFEGGINNFEGGMGNFEGGITNFEGGITNFEGGINNFEGAQELDSDAAKGMGRSAPYAVRACVVGTPGCLSAPPFDLQYHARQVVWSPSTFGHVFLNHVTRKRGNATSAYSYLTPTPPVTSATPSAFDFQQLPNGVEFTYRLRAEFDDPVGFSGFSKATATATITAVNLAPVANGVNLLPDAYTTPRNTQLRVTTRAQGVLGNDNDVDSPASAIFAVLATPPVTGTLTAFNPDGTFTYKPKNGFVGTDTFTYYANNGTYTAEAPAIAMSPNSATVTVTIVVTR